MAEWKNQLDSAMRKSDRPPNRDQALLATFMVEVAVPAFEQLTVQLKKHGRTATIRRTDSAASIMVARGSDEEMTYRLQGRAFPNGILPYAQIRCRQRKGLRLITVESMVRKGAPTYAITDITSEEVIQSFLEEYTRRVTAD